MEIIRVPRVLQSSLKKDRMKGRGIGFVPTMGALHEGHMALMRAARVENELLIASIFVNPTQFGPSEDYSKYPRDADSDISKLRENRVDILFFPDPAAIYPDGFSTSVEVKGLSDRLCGAFRPGHFSGVATIVTKLLNIVDPTRAYFGQKDYQQGLIVRRLVRDLNMDIEIVLCPTLREPDGLAMSSRNAYLNPEERKAAGAIYKSLLAASDGIKSGILKVAEVKGLMEKKLGSEHLISKIDYASAYDPETLLELEEIGGRALLAVAVWIGPTRLIDNLLLEGIK